MLPLNLYAHVHQSMHFLAHEIAGAARTRSSLRPLFLDEGANGIAKLGRDAVARLWRRVLSYPPLEGEGRLRSRRGGVKPQNEAPTVFKTSPPHPVSYLAALNTSRPSPSRGG